MPAFAAERNNNIIIIIIHTAKQVFRKGCYMHVHVYTCI